MSKINIILIFLIVAGVVFSVAVTRYGSFDNRGQATIKPSHSSGSGSGPVPVIQELQESTQGSPDGAIEVIASVDDLVGGTPNHQLRVRDTENNSEQLIYEKQLSTTDRLILPFNTWSPDNRYFFVEYNFNQLTESVKTQQVYWIFNASGEPISQKPYLEVNQYFLEQEIPYVIAEATGWAAPGLLLVNTGQLDSQDPGPSFWFEVSTQNFIQLSTRF